MAAITAGAAAAAAGIGAGSGLISDILNWFNVHHTNDMNERIARENRQFQHDEAILGRQWEEQMANTAYQRSLSDMQAAGLNPNLLAPSSASVGSTSAPQGSSATMQAPHLGDFMTGVSSALTAYANLKLINSLVEKNDFNNMYTASKDDLNRQLWNLRDNNAAKAIFSKERSVIKY